MSRSLKAHLLLVLCTLAWGATFVVIKDALRDSSPLVFNAVRMTVSAVLLAAIFHRQLATITRGSLVAGLVIGTFLWLGYSCQTAGLIFTTASKSAFLTGVSVVLVPVWLWLFWKRHISRWTIAGVGAAFVGLYLMTIPASPGGGLGFESINRGDLLTFGCAVAFAFQIIYVGRATQRHPFAQVVVVEIAASAIWMWLSVGASTWGPGIVREWFTGSANAQEFVLWTPRFIVAIAVTSVICTVAAFIIQGWAQQFTPPTHTALIFSLEPVFAGLTSYVVLNERLGWRAGIGGALIMAGILMSELLAAEQEKAELVEETV